MTRYDQLTTASATHDRQQTIYSAGLGGRRPMISIANVVLAESFIRRAEVSGCETLAAILDTPLLGWRPRDLDPGGPA